MSMIAVQGVSLVRGTQTILHEISFSVERGEILVIIGPSGGGKSSLLRCLNRLDNIQSGTIMLNRVDISTLPIIELRRKVGMIFQQPISFAGTVAENIAYGPTLHGEPIDQARILEIMSLASLDHDLYDHDAQQLSIGQIQRVAVARALANSPDVLLLDEPTSALDPISMRHIEESMLELQKRLNLTQIWVSHTIEQARRIADRVLLLDAGRVVRVDGVEAMLDPEKGDKRALAFASGEAT